MLIKPGAYYVEPGQQEQPYSYTCDPPPPPPLPGGDAPPDSGPRCRPVYIDSLVCDFVGTGWNCYSQPYLNGFECPPFRNP